MPVSPARQAAYRILLRVENGRGFAVDLLQAPTVSCLKEPDRRLATALVMGVMRWRGDLDFEIERLSGKAATSFDAEVLESLRMGAYQIQYLTNVPVHAAVNESVELVKAARKRSAAGLVNAVLRKFARDGGEHNALDRLQRARRSIPEWMRERWQRHFGVETANSILLHSQTTPCTCLRVIGGPERRELMQRELQEGHVRTYAGSYGASALWVEEGDVQAAAREAKVVIQDEASQLVAELVKPEPGQRVLDVCAAPGIKALQIAETLREGVYIACDHSSRRMRTMDKVIRHAWPAGVKLECILLDAAQPLPLQARFHRVLVDAPCSGTGTLARNPEIKLRLLPQEIGRMAQRQALILGHALASLEISGRLVYATCSLEPEENDGVIATVLNAFPGFRQLSGQELRLEFPPMAALFDDGGAFRTLPGAPGMDGFFAAVFERV